jgi:hypothetical protein
MKTLPSDGYEVEVEDGFVAFFSGKGLEKQKARVAVDPILWALKLPK